VVVIQWQKLVKCSSSFLWGTTYTPLSLDKYRCLQNEFYNRGIPYLFVISHVDEIPNEAIKEVVKTSCKTNFNKHRYLWMDLHDYKKVANVDKFWDRAQFFFRRFSEYKK